MNHARSCVQEMLELVDGEGKGEGVLAKPDVLLLQQNLLQLGIRCLAVRINRNNLFQLMNNDINIIMGSTLFVP